MRYCQDVSNFTGPKCQEMPRIIHHPQFIISSLDVYHLCLIRSKTKTLQGSHLSFQFQQVPPGFLSFQVRKSSFANAILRCFFPPHRSQRIPGERTVKTRGVNTPQQRSGDCCFVKMTCHFQGGCLLRDCITHGKVFILLDSVCRSLRNSEKALFKKKTSQTLRN